MRILYCNLLKKRAFAGHKHFDGEWVNLLQKVSEVTLLWPEESWYSNIDNDVRNEICFVDSEVEKKIFLKWNMWYREPLKHLAINNHMEAMIQIKKAIELDSENSFDYIIVSTVDWLVFMLYLKKFKNLERLYFIVHNAEDYNNKFIQPIFKKIKKRVHFIVMETDGISFMHEKYGINNDMIHYIPHMLEPIDKETIHCNIEVCDVVGISNSNNDEEIKKIIKLEESTNFFEKNKIRAIFRSVAVDYKTEYLTVFSGRLGMPYNEYLAYYANAKVVILPFSDKFGIRSSGTIIDAISQNIPILGNPFATMKQYQRKHPNICMIYNNMEEFQNKLLYLLKRKEIYTEEFECFHIEHSNNFILNSFKDTFK